MEITRRKAILSTLFGAGAVGLRSVATGLPVSLLLNPRTAHAGPSCSTSKAQYIIFNSAGTGDPINASCPGSYVSGVTNTPGPTAKVQLGSQSYTAAQPWSTLDPASVLSRTSFWHLMTNTPIHPKETQVLELMGASQDNEMLPSLLAKAVAPCLPGLIQPAPISLCNTTLFYNGQAMPSIPPAALKDALASKAGPLTNLQGVRDDTMNQLYGYYKGMTPAQKSFVDQMALSQTEIRKLNLNLLNTLSSITDNSVTSQILAAVTLIQMKIAPVIGVLIPFGGDNHSDSGLATEISETASGVTAIGSLMSQLAAPGVSLQDQVSFISLNVFGRTLATNGGPKTNCDNGRAHNPNHQVSLAIGKPFKPGVFGACVPVEGDFGASNIDSKTGAGSAGGDIQAIDTLSTFAQTVLAAVGGDPGVVGTVTGGSGTQKVVNAAIAG